MRTTIDLPDDLHQVASSIARDTSRTLSETVAELMRRALESSSEHSSSEPIFSPSPRTGLPVVTLRRPITTEDVRALEDDA